MTKFDYAICIAAALGYLMIHQQDPVGLVTFDSKIRTVLPPHSKRTQLGTILSVLANLKPSEQTDVANSLSQLAPMIRHKSLIMVFSDLLPKEDPVREKDATLRSLYQLRHRGHDIILFHVLDAAEVSFPFEGVTEFEDVETDDRLPPADAKGMREAYLGALAEFREGYREECSKAGIDYVAMDTSVGFDKALLEYLIQRQRRF
jgi:uncharacterized protein (DUF58 family)